jgi:TonB family protein
VVDFTAVDVASDGPGIVVDVAGGSRPSARDVPSPPGAGIARAAPRHVPVGSLGRAPHAPGLDAALEREYPVAARRTGVSGRAVLRVEILPDGRIGVVRRTSESFAGFGEACERTVRSARWEPPIDREGHPVATEITYTCRFEIRS